jgi:hypothetical protein
MTSVPQFPSDFRDSILNGRHIRWDNAEDQEILVIGERGLGTRTINYNASACELEIFNGMIHGGVLGAIEGGIGAAVVGGVIGGPGGAIGAGALGLGGGYIAGTVVGGFGAAADCYDWWGF